MLTDYSFFNTDDVTLMDSTAITLHKFLSLYRLDINDSTVIQAQNGNMRLFAEQKLSIAAASDILFAGKKRVTLIGGGSYLRIEAGEIGYGTTSDYVRKVKRTYPGASATMLVDLPSHDKVADLPPVLNAFSLS